jgi:probable HAF family extracellular repeat protein
MSRSNSPRAILGQWIAALVALICLVDAGAAHAAAYSILDLTTLGSNYSYSSGYSTVNASGQVVGFSGNAGSGNANAFRTFPNTAINPGDNLGTFNGLISYGFSINASGHAVGSATVANGQNLNAFRTGPNANLTVTDDLGTLGGMNSEAFGINTAGQVVGFSNLIPTMAENGAG